MTHLIDEPRSSGAGALRAEIERITIGERPGRAHRLAEALRWRAKVQHVSLAAVDPETGRARVLAACGTDVVRAGLTAFAQQSTRLKVAASGRIWTSSDFAREPDFDLMLDRMAKVVGYRAGCAVPIALRGRPVGVVMLSSVEQRKSWGAVTRDVSAAGPALVVALGLDRGRRARLRVLVRHPDVLVGEGLARVLERGLGAEVRLAHGPYTPGLRSAEEWAEVVVTGGEADPAGGSVAVGSQWTRERILAAVSQAVAEPAQNHVTAPGPPALSRRELDLVRELDAGLSYQAIAARLGLAVETVRTYSKSLYNKLGAHSRGEAVFRARQQGLL